MLIDKILYREMFAVAAVLMIALHGTYSVLFIYHRAFYERLHGICLERAFDPKWCRPYDHRLPASIGEEADDVAIFVFLPLQKNV